MPNYSTFDPLRGYFFHVISLQEAVDIPYEVLLKKAPTLPKGWYELSQLSPLERFDLKRDFWTQRLADYPDFSQFIDSFFKSVTSVDVFLVQKSVGDPYEAQIVYRLNDRESYFHGYPPASEKDILELKNEFLGDILPRDWLLFLQIHNGFFKTTDSTGIFPSFRVKAQYEHIQSFFEEDEVLYSKNQVAINPKRLIPFYKSFGMPYYQCFFGDWYPKEEMGNVYCSLADKTISEVSDSKNLEENLSFPSFYSWLAFYLEKPA